MRFSSSAFLERHRRKQAGVRVGASYFVLNSLLQFLHTARESGGRRGEARRGAGIDRDRQRERERSAGRERDMDGGGERESKSARERSSFPPCIHMNMPVSFCLQRAKAAVGNYARA